MPDIIDYHWLGGLTERSVMIKVIVSVFFTIRHACRLFHNTQRVRCHWALTSLRGNQASLYLPRSTKSQWISQLLSLSLMRGNLWKGLNIDSSTRHALRSERKRSRAGSSMVASGHSQRSWRHTLSPHHRVRHWWVSQILSTKSVIWSQTSSWTWETCTTRQETSLTKSSLHSLTTRSSSLPPRGTCTKTRH